jgi:hypothetical protein
MEDGWLQQQRKLICEAIYDIEAFRRFLLEDESPLLASILVDNPRFIEATVASFNYDHPGKAAKAFNSLSSEEQAFALNRFRLCKFDHRGEENLDEIRQRLGSILKASPIVELLKRIEDEASNASAEVTMRPLTEFELINLRSARRSQVQNEFPYHDFALPTQGTQADRALASELYLLDDSEVPSRKKTNHSIEETQKRILDFLEIDIPPRGFRSEAFKSDLSNALKKQGASIYEASFLVTLLEEIFDDKLDPRTAYSQFIRHLSKCDLLLDRLKEIAIPLTAELIPEIDEGLFASIANEPYVSTTLRPTQRTNIRLGFTDEFSLKKKLRQRLAKVSGIPDGHLVSFRSAQHDDIPLADFKTRHFSPSVSISRVGVVPEIPGYELTGRSKIDNGKNVTYFFEKSAHSPYKGKEIPLSTQQLELVSTWFRIKGFTTLASAVDREAPGNVDLLVSLIKHNSIYYLTDPKNSKRIEEVTIKSGEISAVSGELVAQCDGSSAVLINLLEALNDYGHLELEHIRLVTGHSVSGGKITASTHMQTAFSHEGHEHIFDPTARNVTNSNKNVRAEIQRHEFIEAGKRLASQFEAYIAPRGLLEKRFQGLVKRFPNRNSDARTIVKALLNPQETTLEEQRQALTALRNTNSTNSDLNMPKSLLDQLSAHISKTKFNFEPHSPPVLNKPPEGRIPLGGFPSGKARPKSNIPSEGKHSLGGRSAISIT